MFGGKESGSPASSPTTFSPAHTQNNGAPAITIPNSNKDTSGDSVNAASPASNPISASPALSTFSNTDGPALMTKDKRSNSNASTASSGRPTASVNPTDDDKKRRSSSSVSSKASAFLASAKNSLHFSPSPHSVGFGKSSASAEAMQTPLQKLGRQDPALSVPQGQHNNSAGESLPGPRSTFRVGVWEDKNKKCRRTMEDTHAFLYNFLHTPAPKVDTGKASPKTEDAVKPKTLAEAAAASENSVVSQSSSNGDMMETDNGYFAIFDGHAGTFAADWCGKKLHIILEEMIRANPNTPIPELLDLTFTNVDRQLEKLPLKNSGCTAVCAVLRWEDRIPNSQSATGSTAIAPATAAALKAQEEEARQQEKANKKSKGDAASLGSSTSLAETQARLKQQSTRQRVLYTANVGDARIVLCRNGKALRLSYDHKGSDENEGKRVANAGGLILNNRVNGVLAVTRALGDAYMKDLVTGHPYTTETVVQCGEKGEGGDEFIILACDGLWDVCTDQEAVDLVRHIQDPVTASKALVDHALARFSTDNLSCMIVRLNKVALADRLGDLEGQAIGVEGDPIGGPGTVSEADKIVNEARRKVEEEGAQVGVSGSNSGKGHEPTLEAKVAKIVEEEPHLTEGDSKEIEGVKGKKKEKEISPTRSQRSLNIFRKASPSGSPQKQ